MSAILIKRFCEQGPRQHDTCEHPELGDAAGYSDSLTVHPTAGCWPLSGTWSDCSPCPSLGPCLLTPDFALLSPGCYEPRGQIHSPWSAWSCRPTGLWNVEGVCCQLLGNICTGVLVSSVPVLPLPGFLIGSIHSQVLQCPVRNCPAHLLTFYV